MYIFQNSVKTDLRMQLRNRTLFVILVLTIAINILFLPARNSKYAGMIVYGYTGAYNAEFIALSTAIFTNILISLFGFYILIGRIKQDYDSGVGQLIATTPVSKFTYIFTRFFGYFLVLLSIDITIILSGMLIHNFRGVGSLKPIVFIETHAIIVWPVIVFISALTILIEIIFIFRMGHTSIIYFFFWNFAVAFSILSVDWLGVNTFVNYLDANYVRLDEDYTFISPKPDYATVVTYPGLDVSDGLLINAASLLIISFFMLILSSILFNRFKSNFKSSKKKILTNSLEEEEVISIPIYQEVKLTSVKRNVGIKQYLILIKGELKNITRMSKNKWVVVTLIFIMTLSVPSYDKMLGIVLLLPIIEWAGLPNKDYKLETHQLIASSPKGVEKVFFSRFISGTIIGLLVSSGSAMYFIMDRGYLALFAWLLSVTFVVGLAFFLGSISTSDKLFMIIYLLLWDIGSANGVRSVNYTFTSSGMLTVPFFASYTIFTLIFITISYMVIAKRK